MRAKLKKFFEEVENGKTEYSSAVLSEAELWKQNLQEKLSEF